MKLQVSSTKRALVDKANKTVITVVAIAAVTVTFSLVASKALWDQKSFQDEVINKKATALSQLEANEVAVDSLVDSYSVFVQQQPNIIGGNSQANDERDGDNARIVLDSLPGQLDVPALASSIEKILDNQGLRVSSISVTGDESSGETEIVDEEVTEIPFEFTVDTSFAASEQLFETLQRSIRPMHIVEFSVQSTGGSAVDVAIKATTYFKPAQSLDISTETIR